MIRKELIVVGAGPAGLSAAIEAARKGVQVLVFDENDRPGGQLFKQIHKFFGSKEHRAKVRGYQIGTDLLKEAQDLGVEVQLNAQVSGLYGDKEVTVVIGNRTVHYKADALIVATGASENLVPFAGWTLPGVIGAGAAQTMMNIHGLKPGHKVLMLGSGNVGLVVGYQLLQAGCEVVAVVDASPRIGGYGVHAAKLARCGVPFYLSHTILSAQGTDAVTGVTIAPFSQGKLDPTGALSFEVDTICLAVGLSPMGRLLKMAGCAMKDSPSGGVPVVGETGETSIPGLYAAGDVSGIEEASSAMIEGRIAGLAAGHYLGYLTADDLAAESHRQEGALHSLREGMFAPSRRGQKIETTDEGVRLSDNLLTHGYLLEDELARFPGVPSGVQGVHPVIECTQNIPCNPCQDACKKGCISIGAKISSLPVVVAANPCIACGQCVAACSGQAIFLVDESAEPGFAHVTLPYEFLPLPQPGQKGLALDRSGKVVGEAEVVQARTPKTFDHTCVLTMKVPRLLAMSARFFRLQEAQG
jgi:thioredoxin reductase/Fe-S-cluster-containing hydrogenase component 2